MKVREGDVLICQCQDCDVELVVVRACGKETCGDECACDVHMTCCGEPMRLRR